MLWVSGSPGRLSGAKHTEDEDTVAGSEYSKRLVEQFTNKSALFDWARPEIDTVQEHFEDEDEDPISKLLKSNTAVFTSQ